VDDQDVYGEGGPYLIEGPGGQPVSATQCPVYRAEHADTLVHDGMIPQSDINPQSDYNRGYPPQPRIAHEIGRCQTGSSNQPAPQSQLDLIHRPWSQEDSDKLVRLLRSDQKLPEVAKQLRRTPNQCRFRKTFLDQRDNTKAVAEAMIHVQPAPAQPPAMAGSGNVPFWDQQGGEEGTLCAVNF
jgi:hypothetical protein